MSLKNRRAGASLLELLLAVCMVTISVVIISLMFPKATASITKHRQRLLAQNFASSQMNEWKQKPYAYITPNVTAQFGLVPNCDCSAIDMTTFGGVTPSAIMIDSGFTYSSRVCINLIHRDTAMASGWRPVCADVNDMASTDHGLKSIRVRVVWAMGAETFTTDLESMVVR